MLLRKGGALGVANHLWENWTHTWTEPWTGQSWETGPPLGAFSHSHLEAAVSQMFIALKTLNFKARIKESQWVTSFLEKFGLSAGQGGIHIPGVH